MRITITESQFKKLISESIRGYYNEVINHTTIEVDTAECFPYLIDNNDIPSEITIDVPYVYHHKVSGDYDTEPWPEYYEYEYSTHIDTYFADKDHGFNIPDWQKDKWNQLVNNSGVPEEKLIIDLDGYLVDNFDDLAQAAEKRRWGEF